MKHELSAKRNGFYKIPHLIFFLTFIFLFTQISGQADISISGQVKDKNGVLAYVNVALKKESDSSLVAGSISNEEGRFVISKVVPGKYILETSFIAYQTNKQSLFIGTLNKFYDVGVITLLDDANVLSEIEVSAKQDEVTGKMDKKVFTLENNVSQQGGTILQAIQNLPGVTTQDGKVQIRGSDKVVVLIDGKQTALTGFGNQTSLDNIPASAIDKIEIINNPSAKYDANGTAGIINIIYKKNKQEGFNGKVGLAGGLGALWIKKDNLPGIRPQYQNTPKVNPSLSLNYRKNKLNIFAQGDYLLTHTLNKNEFVDRYYNDGQVIRQQTKRNRNTTIGTAKAGFDWMPNEFNQFSLSALYSSEHILDNGDEPFYNRDLSDQQRLWKFLEDELKTTVTASGTYVHKYKQPGHHLSLGLNYTFHREDEKYNFTNILPSYSGFDAFKLLSDEHVTDFTMDYVKPLKYGRVEGGVKFRYRNIPTNMQFIPGLNSPLDTNAGGWANYEETIPALYGNYVLENKKFELEAGLRIEYVNVNYEVNPNHNTYKSNGYNYTQPFPNVRLGYKITSNSKISAFYNRRVDRPNEVDIRIFPKYDDAEIIKVGNPALNPQFTNLYELGYKKSWKNGYVYAAAYHRSAQGTITRIASTIPGSTLIYSIMQNANKSYNTGLELLLSQDIKKWFSFNVNFNGYQNIIDPFTVENKYPVVNTFTAEKQSVISYNAKFNGIVHLKNKWDVQLAAIYLAPDLIPQGKINTRFSLDIGVKKQIQKGKGEVFLNATDLLNTMQIKKEIQGKDFKYYSADYYETQVVRIGYNYKF
ncbi:TonB-dependent receptor domain-containing protein [Aurantibacillus circumpalustris]|uniref:TonB-dependent receptor domain-containing protein n=1 Tax=Aurantibacillus circumpalustris TaxID=3036359 RepID=UPI00295AD557|nr:TonB-dependent receptor [Aurantibacillus circumpalustris]